MLYIHCKNEQVEIKIWLLRLKNEESIKTEHPWLQQSWASTTLAATTLGLIADTGPVPDAGPIHDA